MLKLKAVTEDIRTFPDTSHWTTYPVLVLKEPGLAEPPTLGAVGHDLCKGSIVFAGVCGHELVQASRRQLLVLAILARPTPAAERQ